VADGGERAAAVSSMLVGSSSTSVDGTIPLVGTSCGVNWIDDLPILGALSEERHGLAVPFTFFPRVTSKIGPPIGK
jgi:hypothetical protein